jgi:hypothetical protein
MRNRPVVLGVLAVVVLGAGGYAAQRAIARQREAHDLEAAEAANTLQAYVAFLQQHRGAPLAARAQARLDTRRQQLDAVRRYRYLLDQMSMLSLGHWQLPESEGTAPSGAMFAIDIARIRAALDSAAASAAMKAALADLDRTLTPSWEANQAFLNGLEKLSERERQRSENEYVKQFPRAEVRRRLEAMVTMAAAEQARIKPSIQELADYEKQTAPSTSK